MGRKQKTIHYLYKTTCIITGRYYIGMRSTSDLEDGYLGSGTRLRRSIRKYGEENHTKEILEFFDCREALIEGEKNAITSEMLKEGNCMNLKLGGEGGFSSDEAKLGRQKTDEILRLKFGNDFRSIVVKHHYNSLSDEEKIEKANKIKAKLKELCFNHQTFLGKKHSKETKQKISDSSKGKGVGKTNSQFGTMWITNGVENRKVKKEDEIPAGWYKGRFKL